MKKKAALLCALIMLMGLLSGCGNSEPQSDPTPDPGQMNPNDWASNNTFNWDDYNPAVEEDKGNYIPGVVYDDFGNPVYAGATPIPLNPIDMPSPTPKPQLVFSYGPVTASNLGISFEAPQGWLIDASSPDTIVLMDTQSYDGVTARLTVRITSVSGSYKLSDAKTEVSNMLKEIGQYNYSSWNPTSIASRTLLKKDGYYADYDGVYYDGTAVWGRVMVALLDNNRVISVHLSAPSGFGFKNVITHFRDTLKGN